MKFATVTRANRGFSVSTSAGLEELADYAQCIWENAKFSSGVSRRREASCVCFDATPTEQGGTELPKGGGDARSRSGSRLPRRGAASCALHLPAAAWSKQAGRLRSFNNPKAKQCPATPRPRPLTLSRGTVCDRVPAAGKVSSWLRSSRRTKPAGGCALYGLGSMAQQAAARTRVCAAAWFDAGPRLESMCGAGVAVEAF